MFVHVCTYVFVCVELKIAIGAYCRVCQNSRGVFLQVLVYHRISLKFIFPTHSNSNSNFLLMQMILSVRDTDIIGIQLGLLIYIDARIGMLLIIFRAMISNCRSYCSAIFEHCVYVCTCSCERLEIYTVCTI